MTIKLLSKLSLKCRTPYLLSATIFGTFFLGVAMAAGGSTPIQGLDSSESATPNAAPVVQNITAKHTAACPLNSGGPSLLGTTWRLVSLYGNKLPKALTIDMRVSTTSLTGMGGCNKYSANFKQVGFTGFTVKGINKTKNKCKVIIPYKAAKSINVGSWEGSYLRTLRRMGSVRQMTDTKLYFFNRNGQIGMKFQKIRDENKEAEVAAQKAAEIAAKKAAVEAVAKEKEKAAEATKKAVMPKEKPISKKTEEKPVVSKISASDDDLINSFFKISSQSK